jgi:hypothetical protein
MNYNKNQNKDIKTMNTTASRGFVNQILPHSGIVSKANTSLKHLGLGSESKGGHNANRKSHTSLLTAVSQKTTNCSRYSKKKTRSNSRKASSGKGSNNAKETK